METKVVLKNESGNVTKVIIPKDCDFEVKDNIIIVTPKKIIRTWEDLIGEKYINPAYINVEGSVSSIEEVGVFTKNYKGLFASEKHAKSALAIAQISQLMPHYGKEITDEEWKDGNMDKYVLFKYEGHINIDTSRNTHFLLAFHTGQQCEDFLKYNEQLIKDYLMIE